MPEIGIPIGTLNIPGAGNELTTIRPEDPTSLSGCPIRTARRAVIGKKGIKHIIEWDVRDRAGNPMDLTGLLGYESSVGAGQIIFRFNDATRADGTIHQIIGEIVDAAAGTVKVQLTDAMAANPGIYLMDIAVTDGDTANIIDQGLLSMENTQFGSIDVYTGPPTLNELRMRTMDYVEMNTLLDGHEFSDNDLIECIIRPIMEWNEMPPPVGIFSTATFPFHYHWVEAVVAELLGRKLIWAVRNRLPVSAGGISIDDKSSIISGYQGIRQELRAQWKEFVLTKKVEINAGLCYGEVGSPYG